MASLKMKGDLAELKVATDLLERGYKIAIPFGEDWDFDLIISRADGLERVQVKHASSNGVFISVKCFSHSLTKGQVRVTKLYTGAIIDWLAVYDATTDRCYYVPAEELANGRRQLILRLTPPRNNQRAGIRTPPTIWIRFHRGSSRWSQRDSNPRPRGCKARALPTELWPRAAILGPAPCGRAGLRGALHAGLGPLPHGHAYARMRRYGADSGGWDGKNGDRDPGRRARAESTSRRRRSRRPRRRRRPPARRRPGSAPRSRTSTSSATTSRSPPTAWSSPTTCGSSSGRPTARSPSRSRSSSPTARSTSSRATGSSTTAPAARTRAASASTPRSTSTRSARSPR